MTTFYGCMNESTKKPNKPVNVDSLKEELITTNQSLSQTENLRIDAFVNRKEWPMMESGTGLRYWIYQAGNGDSIRVADVVKVNFSISLLNGVVCYSSDSSGAQSFKVDMDDVESGLHEAMQLMRVGDKAKLILPPHLAHGLVGDMNKIPGNSSLVYDIEVISKNEI